MIYCVSSFIGSRIHVWYSLLLPKILMKFWCIYLLLLNSFQIHRQPLYTNYILLSCDQNTQLRFHIVDPLVYCWRILCMFYIHLFSRVVHICQIHLNRRKQHLYVKKTSLSCILVLLYENECMALQNSCFQYYFMTFA